VVDRQSAVSSISTDATRMKKTSPRAVRALVVDDEASVCKFVDRVLSEAGYATVTASDGRQALELVGKEPPFDIIVTDVMMPEMTGDELARRLRVEQPGLKVLYLTGFSDRLFKEKVTLWADEAFLDKPCSVKGLLQAVSLLLFGRVDAPKDFAP
jgi:two-component system, cell cycle sensor histidine kinase and response regulator CckA